MEELDDFAAIEWLRAQDKSWWTGFNVRVGERAIWILHAMYEHHGLPGGLSHDDTYRIKRAVEPFEPPADFAGRGAWRQLEAATVIGCPSGKSAPPGPEWRRVRWHEHARRLGINPFAERPLPTFRSFPHRSWPANIRPPAEGALDREQYRHLLERLGRYSPDADHTTCYLLYAQCWDHQRPRLFRGTLGSAREHYDHELVGRGGAPNNIWPEDRSWLTYSDYDLWGTRITGSARLIAALHADRQLDTIDLDRH